MQRTILAWGLVFVLAWGAENKQEPCRQTLHTKPASKANHMHRAKLYPKLYATQSTPTTSCVDEQRLGDIGEGGKWVCGLHRLLPRKDCVVYSFGSHGQDDFEYAVHKAAPWCSIHTFDPGDYEAALQHPDILTYHSWALGCAVEPPFRTLADIAATLNHTHIDILKVDVDGAEYLSFPIFFGPDANHNIPVGQVQLEIHPVPVYMNKRGALATDEKHVAELFDGLSQSGFAIFHREPNFLWPKGMELAFINTSLSESRPPDPNLPHTLCEREYEVQQEYLQVTPMKSDLPSILRPVLPTHDIKPLENYTASYTCAQPVTQLCAERLLPHKACSILFLQVGSAPEWPMWAKVQAAFPHCMISRCELSSQQTQQITFTAYTADAHPSMYRRLIQQHCNVSRSHYDAVVVKGHAAQLFGLASLLVQAMRIGQLLLCFQGRISKVQGPLGPFFTHLMRSGFRLTVLDLDYEDPKFETIYMGLIHLNATRLAQCPKHLI